MLPLHCGHVALGGRDFSAAVGTCGAAAVYGVSGRPDAVVRHDCDTLSIASESPSAAVFSTRSGVSQE